MKSWLEESIREVFSILFVSIFPILIFGLVTLNQSLKMVRTAAEREDEIITANLSNQVQFYINRAKEIIQSLASLPPETINVEILKAVYFNNTFKDLYLFESLMVLTKEGKIEIVYPEREEFLGLDYSRQPSFAYAKEEKKVFFSELKFSSITEQPVVIIAAPIFQSGSSKELAGVIQGTIRLQALSLLLQEFGFERENSHAFLIGKYGEIIAHPDYQLVVQRESVFDVYPELADRLQKSDKKERRFQYKTREGKEYLVTFQTISPTDWKLVTQQNVKTIFAAPTKLRSFLLIILVFTTVGAGVVSYNLAAYLSRTRKQQEKLREERLREAEEARAVLEIKVRARTRELEELAANLEEQVKQRTKELQERINELERFHRLTVGRELTMVELKKEIERLKQELEKYKKT